MLWKKLQRALERGWLYDQDALRDQSMAKSVRTTNKKLAHAVKKSCKYHAVMVKRSQKFLLDVDMSEDDIIEATENARLMSAADELHMPYSACYVEVMLMADMKGQGDGLAVFRNFNFCRQRPGAVGMQIALTAFQRGQEISIDGYGRNSDTDKPHWYMFPSRCYLDTATFACRAERTYPSVEQSEEVTSATVNGLIAIFSSWITLLNMRHGERRDCNDSHADLASRNRPQNGYTVVSIRERSTSTGSGQPGRVRLRPRLHLRRGHIRRQRYGRDLQLEKRLWIKPTMVGNKSEGIVRHEYRAD